MEKELLRRLEENDRLFLRHFYSLLDDIFSQAAKTTITAYMRKRTERDISELLQKEIVAVFALGEAHAALLCKDKMKKFAANKLSSFIPWFLKHNLAELPDVKTDWIWVRPEKAIEAFKQRENMLAHDINDKLWNEVKAIVNQQLEGMPRKEAVAKINALQEVTKKRAKLIVVTESTYAYNRGRLAGFAKAGVDYVRFSAIMDARTSQQCRSRHGKIMRLDSSDLAENIPPLHGHCRSILSPLYGEYEAEKITADSTDWSKCDPLPKGWKTSVVDKPAYLRMLNIDSHKDDVAIVKTDIARLPKKHLELLQKNKAFVTFGYEYAHFNRCTGEIAISMNTIPGELIHEVGHAVETYLNLYENAEFIKVLQKDIPIDDIGFWDFTLDMFGKIQVGYLSHPSIKKFISEYQSSSYECDVFKNERFIEKNGKKIFNVLTLGEYFAEGYRAYFLEPQLLQEKDPRLYQFIKELINS